jgi:hypothetical protein
LLYHVSHPGVRWESCRKRSRSLKTWLPMMLIWRIFAASPSSTAKLSDTRLRSSGVTVVLTLAA